MIDEELLEALDSFTASDRQVGKLGELSKELVEARAKEAQLEDELKQHRQHIESISAVAIPEAMDAAGISKFTLDDGTTISAETFYQASIPADTQEKAFDWLEEQGNADIIKHEVKLALKKGQAEEAAAATKALENLGMEPTVAMKVHPSTLRAFVREEIEAGREVDESIKVFVGRRSKIQGVS